MSSGLRDLITNEIKKVERERRYYAEKIRQDKLLLDHDTDEFVLREHRLSELCNTRKKLR